MENILQGIQTDFRDIPAPKDFLQLVHKTLGGLIKARRVYYTGKGYFLVVPDKGEQRTPSWEEQFQKFVRPGSVPPALAIARDLRESAVQTEDKGEGSCSSFSGGSRALPLTPQQRPGGGSPHQRLTSSPHIRSGESPHQSPPTISQSPATPNLDSSADSREESPRSPMERSQSFRINKKAQKLATKGGSLRLSKKDAAIFKDDAGDTTVGKNEDEEEERESPTPKKMERKNSVLGRLFGRKKSSSSPKKEILTFNAQFPPPDLIEHMRAVARAQAGCSGQAAETQTPPQRKRSQQGPSRPVEERGQPSPPVQQLPPSSATMHHIKTGPNGNFVMYEKGGGSGAGSPPVPLRTPLSPAARRPLPQSPLSARDETSRANLQHLLSAKLRFQATATSLQLGATLQAEGIGTTPTSATDATSQAELPPEASSLCSLPTFSPVFPPPTFPGSQGGKLGVRLFLTLRSVLS